MIHRTRQHQFKSGWRYFHQALVMLAVVMLVLPPLAAHDDAHAGHADQQMSISLDGFESHNDGGDDDEAARCCHPAAGCAAIVLTKPFVVSKPMMMPQSVCQGFSELWQGRQAQPELRPPIL